jgi:hypothetical protein
MAFFHALYSYLLVLFALLKIRNFENILIETISRIKLRDLDKRRVLGISISHFIKCLEIKTSLILIDYIYTNIFVRTIQTVLSRLLICGFWQALYSGYRHSLESDFHPVFVCTVGRITMKTTLQKFRAVM